MAENADQAAGKRRRREKTGKDIHDRRPVEISTAPRRHARRLDRPRRTGHRREGSRESERAKGREAALNRCGGRHRNALAASEAGGMGHARPGGNPAATIPPRGGHHRPGQFFPTPPRRSPVNAESCVASPSRLRDVGKARRGRFRPRHVRRAWERSTSRGE